MKFDKDLLEFHYSSIMKGFSPFLCDNNLYFGRHVSLSQIFEANAQSLLNKEKFIKNGLQSEYAILKELEQDKIWTFDDEQAIRNLEVDIKAKANNLPHLFLPSQITQLKGEINELSKKIKDKENKRASLLSHSLEAKLGSDKNEYIIYLSIYKNVEERLWPTFNDFLDEDDGFVNSLMVGYCRAIGQITPQIIRAAAKSTDARSRLKGSSPCNPMEISVFLMELKQWCGFYDSIYDLTDRPSEDTIQDDNRLDAWVDARRAKTKAENSVNNSEGGGFTSFPGANKQDMEALGGTDRKMAVAIARQEKAQNGG